MRMASGISDLIPCEAAFFTPKLGDRVRPKTDIGRVKLTSFQAGVMRAVGSIADIRQAKKTVHSSNGSGHRESD